MKRFAIIVAAIFLAQTLSAQIITSRNIIQDRDTGRNVLQKGYRGFAEGALMINPDIEYRLGFNISTIHGYQFNHWFYMGGGVGLSGADMPHAHNVAMAVPIFVDFRCYFSRTRRLKPFIGLQLGYNISCGSKEITYDWGDVQYNHVYVYGKPHILAGAGLEYKWVSLKLAYSLWSYTYSINEIDIEEGVLMRSDKTSKIMSSFCIGIGFNF